MLLVVVDLLVSLVLVSGAVLVYFAFVGGCGGELLGDGEDVLGCGFGVGVLVVGVEGVVPDSGGVGWAAFDDGFPCGGVLGCVVFLVDAVGDVGGELVGCAHGALLGWFWGVWWLEVVFCLEAWEAGHGCEEFGVGGVLPCVGSEGVGRVVPPVAA